METTTNFTTPPVTTPPLQTVKAEAGKLSSTVKAETSETAEKVKEEAKAAVGTLKDAGLRFAETQKNALSEKTGELAGAVRALCTKLEEAEEPNLLTGPAQSAEAELSNLSNYLQNASPAQVLQGAERLARRKPELVFGGLFLTGLMVARFLKASSSRTADCSREEARKQLPRNEAASGFGAPTYFNSSNV